MEGQNVTDFTPEERAIFEYMGRYYDPMELNAKLQAFLGGRAEELIRDFYRTDNPHAAAAAWEPVVGAVHAAFGFERFNPETGQGATYGVWNGALEAYLDFFRRHAPSTGTSPTSAPPMEPPPFSPGDLPQETCSASDLG